MLIINIKKKKNDVEIVPTEAYRFIIFNSSQLNDAT